VQPRFGFGEREQSPYGEDLKVRKPSMLPKHPNGGCALLCLVSVGFPKVFHFKNSAMVIISVALIFFNSNKSLSPVKRQLL